MASIVNGSFSLLTQTNSTFIPNADFLAVGEPYVNSADGTLWIGTELGRPLEIGLNARSGLIQPTGKYLKRDTSIGTDLQIPYSSANLTNEQYYEFYIFCSVGGVVPPSISYGAEVNWGSVPNPIPSLSVGKSLLIKLFSYGTADRWSAIPVWSDDPDITIFGGNIESKFYYSKIVAPSGLVMPQRTNLKFQSINSATLLDDLANDTTVVEFGRNLITKISSTPNVSLDYNLSQYYVLDGTTSLNLPGGSSPTLPFELTVKNSSTLNPITINQGTLTTLPPDSSAILLYDGTNYGHILFGGGSGGGGGGEVNTGSNLGTGFNIFASKVGVDLKFNSIANGTNIQMSSTAGTILIESIPKILPISSYITGSNITLTGNENSCVYITPTANLTLTLPASPANGRYYKIRSLDGSFNITVKEGTTTIFTLGNSVNNGVGVGVYLLADFHWSGTTWVSNLY